MSDDEDDVVVLRVCHNRGCMGMEDLQFDEEVGEMFCARCRDLFSRALSEGFYVLLNEDDQAVAQTIFAAFDKGGKGFWTWSDFQDYLDRAVNRKSSQSNEVRSSEDLREYFEEEFDIKLQALDKAGGAHAVTLRDLLNMYGGYLYNNVNALREDAEQLEEDGAINLSALE